MPHQMTGPPDPARPTSHTAGTIAERLRARVVGDAGVAVHGLGTSDSSQSTDLTFLRSKTYMQQWIERSSGPRSALVAESVLEASSKDIAARIGDRTLIVVPDVDLALIQVLTLLAPASQHREAGIHASAIVHPTANVDANAHVGPGCVIEAMASIGPRCVLVAQVYVGSRASISDGTTLHPGVRVLDRCTIGRDCILHSGVVIGADGFGYRPDGKGLLKIPHIGIVEIGDDVEIGANSCVDRAKFGSTTIGSGTKIDNLVQIAHNCIIGRSCIICGEAGLAGSVTLGDGVMLGAKVGIADNLSVGSGARVGSMSGVMNNIPAGETWLGAPAGPAQETLRMLAQLRRMGRKK